MVLPVEHGGERSPEDRHPELVPRSLTNFDFFRGASRRNAAVHPVSTPDEPPSTGRLVVFSASESFFIFRFFIEHLPVRRRTSYNNRTDSTGTFFLNMRSIYRTL